MKIAIYKQLWNCMFLKIVLGSVFTLPISVLACFTEKLDKEERIPNMHVQCHALNYWFYYLSNSG